MVKKTPKDNNLNVDVQSDDGSLDDAVVTVFNDNILDITRNPAFIEIGMQGKTISIEKEKPCKATVTFEFTVENVGLLKKYVKTKTVTVGLYNWYVVVSPWVNPECPTTFDKKTCCLGLFVQSTDFGPARRKKEKDERGILRCNYNVAISVKSRKTKIPPLKRVLDGFFDCTEKSHGTGYPMYATYLALMDKSNGYITNNSATFEVVLNVEETATPTAAAFLQTISALDKEMQLKAQSAAVEGSSSSPSSSSSKSIQRIICGAGVPPEMKAGFANIFRLVCNGNGDNVNDVTLGKEETVGVGVKLDDGDAVDFFTVLQQKIVEEELENTDTQLKLFKLLYRSDVLDIETKRKCRLVCQKWRTFLDRHLSFGIFISDANINNLVTSIPKDYFTDQNETCPSKLAIYNLSHNQVNEKNLIFCKQIVIIFIEQLPPNDSSKSMDTTSVLHNTSVCPIPCHKNATVSPGNIYRVLKLCTNIRRLVCNSTEVNNLRDKIPRKSLMSIQLNYLCAIQAEISAADFDAYFGGLLGIKFPNLRIVEFKFLMACNALTLEDYALIFKFYITHKVQLRSITLMNPPLVKLPILRSTKMQKRNKSSPASSQTFMNQKDKLTSEFSFDGFKTEELKIALVLPNTNSKVEYAERQIELKFLHSFTGLKSFWLVGFEQSDITQVVRRNKKTLESFHITDAPGFCGRNTKSMKYNSREFDASVLREVQDIKQIAVEDFRFINVRNLGDVIPSNLNTVTLVTYIYPNKFYDQKFFKLLGDHSPYTSPNTEKCMRVVVEIVGQNIQLDFSDILEESKSGPPTRVRSATELQRIPTLVEKYFRKHGLPSENLKVICQFKFNVGNICESCARKMKCKESNCSGEPAKKKTLTKTVLNKLPEKAVNAIFQRLSFDDKKNCRLVCEEWNKKVSQKLDFGFWFNDGTASWVRNTNVDISYLVASDLYGALDYKKSKFLSRVKVLILEAARNSFISDGKNENYETHNTLQFNQAVYGFQDISQYFFPRDSNSIEEANIKWLITNAKNLTVLIFNKYALSNFIKCGTSEDTTIIEGNNFQHLKCLTVTVTAMEVYLMENLLKHEFPVLTNFSIRFYCLKRTFTLEQYECIFQFIYNHRKTLKFLEIFDPPLPPKATASASVKKQNRVNDFCYCCSCTTLKNGETIQKTTTTSATTRNKKTTVVKTTTVTTTSAAVSSRLVQQTCKKNTDGGVSICANSHAKPITKQDSVESFKSLSKKLCEVNNLTDVKIVFKTNISGKWLLGLHLLQAQTNLEELYLEGVLMSVVYGVIQKNSKTLQVLHIYSPLLVPANTPGTAEDNSSTFNSEVLRNCVNLRLLAIHSFQYFTTLFTRYLLPKPQNFLRVLELTIGADMLDQYFEGLPEKLYHLEILVLKSNKALNDKIIFSFLKNCSFLKRMFLSKITNNMVRFVQSIPGVYLNHINNENWAILDPDCNENGNYDAFIIPKSLVDYNVLANLKQKKKVVIDSRSYGKKYCPVISLFPAVYIFFGPYMSHNEMRFKCNNELDHIRLNFESTKSKETKEERQRAAFHADLLKDVFYMSESDCEEEEEPLNELDEDEEVTTKETS